MVSKPRRLLPLIALGAMLTALVSTVGAETVMTVEEIGEYARSNGRDAKSALANLALAEEGFEGVIAIENSSLKLDGSYTLTPDSASTPLLTDEDHDASASATVTVPIIPQLSLSARFSSDLLDTDRDSGAPTVDWDPRATLSLTASPFASMPDGFREWETHQKALVRVSYTEQLAVFDAQLSALAVLRSQMNLAVADENFALEERKQEISKKQYELGDISYSELQDSGADLNTARKQYFDAQKALLSAQKALYTILGPELGLIEVVPLELEDMLSLVDALQVRLQAADAADPVSQNLKYLEIELAALNRQLEETPLLQPSLTLSANSNIPFTSVAGSISITLSPNQVKDEERRDIREAIEDKQLDISTELLGLELELQMLQRSIAVAREAYEVSVNDLERAETIYEETKFFHERGERTDIELEEASLSVTSAEIRLFGSTADLYSSLGDLLLLFVLA